MGRSTEALKRLKKTLKAKRNLRKQLRLSANSNFGISDITSQVLSQVAIIYVAIMYVLTPMSQG